MITKTVKMGKRAWTVEIPLAPVPASRPRVGRWGTYYLKTYANWKAAAEEYLGGFVDEDPVTTNLRVTMDVWCKRPQKLTRVYPRPDVDNFAKAALDAVTKAGCIWKDDDQVVHLRVKKAYSKEGVPPSTTLIIEEI